MAPAGPELAGSCCDTVGIGDCNPARRRRAPDGDPLYNCKSAEISLSPAALPFYVLRTVVRMLAALILSLIFTFTYATLAGKSRRAETVLIPLLDVLQSVPILGYLSFTVVFFISLFPGNTLGPELAAVFAIFTSQAWNRPSASTKRYGPFRAISTRQAAASAPRPGSCRCRVVGSSS